MKGIYKITKHNSTVCGYPGRDFDWSKFCWDGSATHADRCHARGCKHCHTYKAHLPWVAGKSTEYGEYLHVPYNWEEDCTIFRVRANDTMYVGEIYRGKKVISLKAVGKADRWYWELELS